jgi:small subunit ribosomal protein S14
MAKKSVIERNKKRIRLVQKYAQRRRELKEKMRDPNLTDEQFFEYQRELTSFPRNSCTVRVRNRCEITGRQRAYLGKFGLSRITFRELALEGKIPGIVKSSW